MKVFLERAGRELVTRAFGWVAMAGVAFLLGVGVVPAAAGAEKKVVLVVTADASDYVLAAGGTIAAMIDDGATPTWSA